MLFRGLKISVNGLPIDRRSIPRGAFGWLRKWDADRSRFACD